MLENADHPEVKERLQELAASFQSGESLVEMICNHPEPFSYISGERGFEFAARSPVEGRPNRAVLKFFKVDDGPLSGSDAVFFYKTSQLPFSSDRFSYGVCLPTNKESPAESQKEWLNYAASGFDPEQIPQKLRRAFTFTIPR